MDIDWRKESNAPDPGTKLCTLDELEPGIIREFKFGAHDPFRMIVYRKGEDIFAYVNQCPHQWQAMNREPEKFLLWDEDEMMCGYHGAVFRLIAGGECIMGPCQGSNLTLIPLQVVEGQVRIAEE